MKELLSIKIERTTKKLFFMESKQCLHFIIKNKDQPFIDIIGFILELKQVEGFQYTLRFVQLENHESIILSIRMPQIFHIYYENVQSFQENTML
jgi:hypothetical protein